MKRILAYLLFVITVLGQKTENNLTVRTNLIAGKFSISSIPNVMQGSQLLSDEQDLATTDPAVGYFAVVKTGTAAGHWYWDSTSTATEGDGVISALGYATGRWIRLVALTVPDDLDPNKGVVIGANKVLQQSTATKQQVDNTAMQVATVSAMQALTAAQINNGQIIQTGGRNSSGDGGGARFRWVSGATTATNLGTVFAPSSGSGRFEWVQDGPLVPEMFGAVGYDGQDFVPYAISTNSTAVTGAFSVYVRAVWPTFSDGVNARGVLRLVASDNSNTRAFEAYGASGYFTVGFRGTNGSYSPTAAADDSGYLFFSSNIFTGLASTTNDLVITRSGGTLSIYVNGTNHTSSASVVNAAGITGATLAGGTNLLLNAGFSSQSQFWRAPVFQMMFWDRALTASEAASPSTATGSVASVTSPQTSITDSSVAIQGALNDAAERGSTPVAFSAKTYYINDSEVFIPAGVSLIGQSLSLNQSFGKFPYSRISSLFSSTNRAVLISSGDYLSTPYFLSPTSWGDDTLGYNRVSGSSINGLAITSFSTGDGLWLDKTASFAVDGSFLYSAYGHPARVDSANAVVFSDTFAIGATYSKPFRLYQVADSQILNSQIGGIPGQLLLGLPANKNVFSGNILFNSINNSSQVQTVTVNTNTSLFSVSSVANFVRGQALWFQSSSGGAPPTPYDTWYTPLTNGSTVYWGPFFAVPTGNSTFYLHTRYSTNSIGSQGAMQGNYRAVTSAVSGTVSIGSGPVANTFFNASSGNVFSSSRIDQSYADGMLFANGFANTIVGNAVIESGWSGSAGSSGIRMIGESAGSVSANSFGKTRSGSIAENGIVLLNSSSISQAANIYYSIATNTYSDTSTGFVYPNAASVTNYTGDVVLSSRSAALTTGATAGFAYLPNVAGNPSGAPTSYTGQSPLAHVPSTRRLYARDTGGSAWHYAPMVTSGSANTLDITANNVLSLSSGASTSFTATGSGTIQSLSTSSSSIQDWTVASDTASAGPSTISYRARGTLSAPTQVQSGDEVGEFTWAARDNAGAYQFNLARIRVLAQDNITSSAKGGGLYFLTTAVGGTTEAVRMTISGNGVQVGTGLASSSAALEVVSTTQGVRFPNMTTVQRDAISSPAEGLVIFNTTDTKLQVRAGAAWVNLH